MQRELVTVVQLPSHMVSLEILVNVLQDYQ